MLETNERKMVRKMDEAATEERFTSLQPEYEDSVPPLDERWEYEE